jgi:putative ATP-dependent endonuclease of OLD family
LAYIQSWLVLSGQLEKFRGTGCHIVPSNGKSHLVRPLIIAQHLGIPVYTLFDADGDKSTNERGRHEADNKALLQLLGGDPNTLFPDATIQTALYTIWPSNMGKVVDAELEYTLGRERYSKIQDQARDEYGQDGSLEKNTLLIGSKLFLAKEAGGTSASLDRLCQKLLEFGGIQPATLPEPV